MISAVSWVHLGICFGLLKVVSPSLGIDPYGVEPEVGMVSLNALSHPRIPLFPFMAHVQECFPSTE